VKARLMAGALAFALWGGVAAADEQASRSEGEVQGPVLIIEDERSDMAQAEERNTDERVFIDDEEQLGVGGAGDIDRPDLVVADDTRMNEDQDKKSDMRGLTVLLGGGVEGYTGDLAPRVDPGVAYGVTAAIKPSTVLGLELGYSGALNSIEVDDNLAEDLVEGGPDIVRNGGHAAVTLGLGAAPVQPYVLGGVGLSRYSMRNNSEAQGFSDATVPSIPLGAGLRTHFGDFTADARVNWNVLLDSDFAPGVESRRLAGLNAATAGRYNATINLGTTF
jgi:hypothetical protein